MSSPGRLVVVGGGIIGTMHALWGLRLGYDVIQIERDIAPRGASVRNFGLIWVGGRATGPELALALVARELWAQIAQDVPELAFRPNGSLTIARTVHERNALEAASTLPDAEQRGFRFLDRDELVSAYPEFRGNVQGALRCERDAIVEPRLVLATLRSYLASRDNYEWLTGRHVIDVRSHGVRDHTGMWHDGDLVACCIGASPGGFLKEALEDEPVRRVRLQMLETEPYEYGISAAIADGDSLRYYPAYQGDIARRLQPQEPLALAWGMQLLLVQRVNGCLTIGDTHDYEEPFPFDTEESPYAHLLGVARDILGEVPQVQRRWAGIYSQVTDESLLYLRSEIEPGVVVVTGPGGRGMTMSPAIARETFT